MWTCPTTNKHTQSQSLVIDRPQLCPKLQHTYCATGTDTTCLYRITELCLRLPLINSSELLCMSAIKTASPSFRGTALLYPNTGTLCMQTTLIRPTSDLHWSFRTDRRRRAQTTTVAHCTSRSSAPTRRPQRRHRRTAWPESEREQSDCSRRQASRQAGRQAGSRQAGKQAGRQAGKHADKQAGRQQTDRQTDRQTCV